MLTLKLLGPSFRLFTKRMGDNDFFNSLIIKIVKLYPTGRSCLRFQLQILHYYIYFVLLEVEK